MRTGAGFTLVELLVTVAVAGILFAIAIPNFQRVMASNRLSSTANEFISAFNGARLEAVRRNTSTQFCSNVAASNGTDTLGAACGTTAGATFTLDAGATTATQLRDEPRLASDQQLGTGTHKVAGLRFNAQGFAHAAVGGNGPYTGLLVDLSSTSISTDNRRCIYVTTGSIISSCTVTNSGGCPANEPTPCQR